MTENVENLILEHLKAFQAEFAAIRRPDQEVMARLNSIEKAVARIGSEVAHNFQEQIADRHAMDRLRERVERIERRLELED